MRFTAPDLVELKLDGDFELEHMEALLGFFDEVERSHGKFFFIDDLSKGGSFSSEARKKLAAHQAILPTRGIAFIGGSLTLRTTLGMVVRAFQLMGRLPYPTTFCADRESALGWVAEQRAASPSLAS